MPLMPLKVPIYMASRQFEWLQLPFLGLRQFSTEMAGIAVRFPRMLRIRNDTRIDEADTLETLRSMLT